MLIKGAQKELKRCDFNAIVKELSYDLEDLEARVMLAKFLKHNIGFTFHLISGIELLPLQEVILRGLFLKDNGLVVAGRGFSKSFLISVFCCLYPLFYPDNKICLISVNFRGARRLFDASEKFVNGKNAGLLHACFPNPPKRLNDIISWKLPNNSEIFALPLSCLTEDTLITINNKICFIKDLFSSETKEKTWEEKNNVKIWSRGKFREVPKVFYNGVQKTKKLITYNGYEIEGTLNHKIKVCKESKLQFESLDNINEGDFIPIDITPRWFKPELNYKPEDAYVVGLMIGDGCLVREWCLHYTDKQGELINLVKIYTQWEWITYDNHHYYAFGTKRKNEWLKKWDIEPKKTLFKEVPLSIWKGNKECAAMFLRGLFDADGNVQVSTEKGGYSVCVRLTNTSKKLINQVQFLLTHFGIVSYISSFDDGNPNHSIKYDLIMTGLDCDIYQKYIGFNLSYKKELLQRGLNKKKKNLSFRGIPYAKKLMLKIAKKTKIPYSFRDYSLCFSKLESKKNINLSFASKFLSYYAPWASHLEEYKLLKNLCNPNIFYDKVKSVEWGEKKTYDINVPDNHEYTANGFLSHNSGEGLRGTRASVVVVDEGLLISKEIQESIIRPFLTARQNFAEESKMREIEDELIRRKEIEEEDRLSFQPNKYLVFSSASYKFQYLYQMFEEYKTNIIEPSAMYDKENQRKPSYFVVRASYEALPDDSFMDKSAIQAAKASGSENSEYFKREYRGLFGDGADGYFDVKKLHECTIPPGHEPTVQMCGQNGSKYILAIDPSYSKSMSSDHFAMGVYLLIPEKREIMLVHSYARAGGDLLDHYMYFAYLLTSFNIVYSIIDSSGTEFIDSFNNSTIAAERGLKVGLFNDVDFDKDDYMHQIQKAKQQYNITTRNFIYPQRFSSDTNRRMNEYLQANIAAKKVWFASRICANDDAYKKHHEKATPFKIKDSLNNADLTYINWMEEQDDWIDETKNELALIEVKSTVNGILQYDLPRAVKRDENETRARRDNYTCCLLACYGARQYFDILFQPEVKRENTFIPFFV